MDYYRAVQPYKLLNLGKQLKTPTLLRVDVNLPAKNGHIAGDALRMRVYAHIIELYSENSGLVVTSHQGGKIGESDFTSLEPHLGLLSDMLPKNTNIELVPYEKFFTDETRCRIRNLKPREILLLDNVRYFDHEFKFDKSTDKYIPFFKGTINTCINDSMPTWHRNNSSLMCLPYIAPTYVGMRSIYELKILNEVITNKESKALISGGAKLEKLSTLDKILKSGVEIFTGGVPGQLIARVNGYDLGEKNNSFLQNKFDQKDITEAKELSSRGVQHPIDFVVEENDERKNVDLKEMPKSSGIIKDIGAATVEKYAELLQGKSIRVRAGPLGKYEEGYSNGTKLTKKIGGEGLIFLGGDSSQELANNGILSHIEDSGGRICVSGGSFLHGWAGNPYPSIDLLLELYK